MLTHLTRLTRLCISSFESCEDDAVIQVPNDPAALPSAGHSLRVLELARDYEWEGHQHERGSIEALLPLAAGLESLVIRDSRLSPAAAARLAAALPRDMARLHIGPRRGSRAWAALPVTSLLLDRPPADLALLAGAARLERLIVESVSGTKPAALAAALQALPRLRVLQLGTIDCRAFNLGATSGGGAAAPPDGAAKASDAFVAAAARLPSLQYLSLAGFYLGRRAKAALLEAAPRLSALRLWACGLSDEAAPRLSAQLRAAAGRGPLSAPQRPLRCCRCSDSYRIPIDEAATTLDVCPWLLPY
jgi:hypothetical protein